MSFAQAPRPVPPRALALALASLAVPVAAAFTFPEWIGEERGVLTWMTALIPAFLLAYYRGLRGVAVALAAGMAALSLTQAILQVTGLATPNWPILLAIIAAYVAICIALAILAELLHREREAAVRLALVDPLTGLPNRRQAELTLDAGFAAAMRGGSLAVVLFDLDHFKRVNDEHGHDAGDEALRAFAESLQRNTRRMNLSARFGGEEFITVLSKGDLDSAKLFANRVRDEIRAVRFPWGTVTASAGAAAYEDGMGSYEVLVAAADRALYAAKEAGRDRLVTAKPTVRPKPPPAPIEAPAVAAASAPPAAASVLVVDDDPDIRTWAVRVLRQAGYQVQDTDNADEAIRRFRDPAQTIDLLVTDVMMPRMNGLTLADHISALRPQLRVVYMSGYIQRTEPWAGLPGAVVGLVAKPIRAPDFLATIQDVLSRTPQTT